MMMRIASMLIGVAVLLAVAATAGANTVVYPANMDSWAFYLTDNNGIINQGSGTGVAQMVLGPASPPLGTGSANLATGAGHGDESAQLRNSGWVATRIDALTSLGYSTYATAWNGQQVPYLTIYLDTTGDGVRDDRLWFEPTYSEDDAGNGNPSPQPDLVLNTWQTWDCLTGMWYSDSHAGPGSNAITLAAYLALEPNATIINDAGQGIGGIRLASGFASASDDFNAYVDNFTIGTAAGTTTYDFEVTPEPATMGFLALGGVAALVRRMRRRMAAR
jgi:hypothetical protein